jgi:hypothetical protein
MVEFAQSNGPGFRHGWFRSGRVGCSIADKRVREGEVAASGLRDPGITSFFGSQPFHPGVPVT